MASQRLNAATLSLARLASRRMMSTKVESVSSVKQSIELSKFDPNNYSVPLRPITMDDEMEPYGSWKVAYAAEKKRANMALIKGIVTFTGALVFIYYGGVLDGIILPNLDNIMEDTQPFTELIEKEEGRISV